MKISRRIFIKKSITGATGAILLPSFIAKSTKISDEPVVIIGAGIAGLAAAGFLKSNGFTNVTLLEARNRTGGRIWTDRSLGLAVDLGASWIHGPKGENPITAIAQKIKAKTFLTDDESLIVYNMDGKTIADNVMDKYYNQYVSLLKKVENLGKPNKSFYQVVKEINPAYLTDPIMQYQLSAYAEFDAGGPIEELSSKYWEDDENFPGKDVLLPDGYDAIITYLSKNLDIQLNTTVTELNYSGKDIIIQTSKGDRKASYVICTLPLGVLKSNQIKFTPALPATKQNAIKTLKMGYVNKVALLFPKAFWNQDIQYAGYCSAVKGQYNYFLNVKKFSTANMLMTFGFGNYGLSMESQPDKQITADVMVILRKIYGNNIPNPIQTLITRWNKDPYTLGAYSFANVGSSPADFEEFENSVNEKIFFAGEHISHDYRGTVHGAYLSGIREAKNIMEMEE